MKARVAILKVLLQDGSLEELEVFSGDSISIGRTADNQLVLDDSKVSRRHAVLNASSLGLIVSDLSSLNGSYLNKKRIRSPEKLCDGDNLMIGNCMIKVLVDKKELPEQVEASEQTQAASMQRTTATVLLADVRNYTKMSEQLPIEDVSSMLQFWLNGVSEIVQTRGGTVDKYIGDCMMSFFAGENSDSEKLALTSVECAKEIINFTEELSNSGGWKHQDSFDWECGVALYSGEAFLGALGNRKLRDFTIVGDTVNSAFRLESLMRKYPVKIILGYKTKELLEGIHKFESLGKETLEGKSEQEEIFCLLD